MWAASLALAAAATPAGAQDPQHQLTLAAPLERIYAAGVPTSVDELRLMDEHQRMLVQRLLQVTVGLEIGQTQGSGVIVSADGYILTAAHVAGDPDREVRVRMSDGRRLRGRTRGLHRGMDAGLIQIEELPREGAERPAGGTGPWPYAEMGTIADLRPGSWCLALGHPGGYQPDRQPAARFGRVLSVSNSVIETDCVLIGGDSGGPLFDMQGHVIGVHSRIGSKLTKNLHVPIHAFRDNWARLARGDAWGTLLDLIGRPMIGVLGVKETDAPRIAQVIPASPAESAGLQPGDLVTRFGDEEVRSFDDLKALVARRNPGDEVTVVVVRGSQTREFPLVIGAASRPDPAPERPGEGGEFVGRLVPHAADASGGGKHARDHTSVLQAFRGVVGLSAQCTVRVLCHDEQVALGTIFDADGLVATKGSELDGPAVCELADGTRHAAELLGVDRGSDLAVLKIPAQGLPVIRWRAEEPPAVGSWVATPGLGALRDAVGIVSVAPHQIRGAVLGIQLTEDHPGPRVTFVVPGSGAANAGLLRGDIITHIDTQTIESANALVAATSAMLPGDTVQLTIQRADQTEHIAAVLGSVAETLSGQRAQLQDRLGGPLSARRVLFPSALEHDTVLLPNQCGGPLVDLAGNAVGINIARANRVASYAIPADVARPLLEAFKTRTMVTVSHSLSPEP